MQTRPLRTGAGQLTRPLRWPVKLLGFHFYDGRAHGAISGSAQLQRKPSTSHSSPHTSLKKPNSHSLAIVSKHLAISLINPDLFVVRLTMASMIFSDDEAKYLRAVLKWQEKNPDDNRASWMLGLRAPKPVGEFRILVIGAKGVGKTSILKKVRKGSS